MRISRIFPLLIAALAGNPRAGGYGKFKTIAAGNLQSANGGGFGKPQRGWRHAQSVASHREIQRRKRRNA